MLDNIYSIIERRQDILESIVWDAEGQKLSDLTLVGFVVGEVRPRIIRRPCPLKKRCCGGFCRKDFITYFSSGLVSMTPQHFFFFITAEESGLELDFIPPE